MITSASSPLMLGFFFNRRRHYPRVHDKVSFFPTCSEGSKLKSQAPPHPFDESLSFLGLADETVFYIKGVSNGFLQEFDPMTYYICNPITKNRIALPKPSMTYTVVPTELNSPSPSVVINEQGVVHWMALTEAIYHCILVYDPRQEFLQLVELPGEKRCFYFLGLSDGLTLYARHDRHELEIFVLQERYDYTKEWSIIHKDSIEHKTLYENVHWNNNLRIRGFHPLNPLVLFLTVEISSSCLM
ncbi:hypothetical protein FRX31_004878 [Thalictrum thalictroides]|uniref:F-box protein n=1 Tax=Thalictrum thalictroides TaxID=46969 RepID=A0A7J6X9R3_THATH|nr:hypothetical protein FRX31_004878 [Thalictrum thalictroides]